MSAIFLELERVESRVLGALRCTDGVTGTPIDRPLEVRAAGADILRNRSGLYVIRRAEALAAHEASFEAPPALPAQGSVALALTVADPLGAYLPRRATVLLPRDPDPANAGTAASLFRPLDLPLYPSPAAPLAVNWAVLRISLVAAGGEHLGGALLRVLRNGNVLARGLTDWRGEGLLPVAGVPVTTFSEDEQAVVISEIEVTVQALLDPAALEAAAATLPATQQNVAIAARRAQALSLSLTLP